MGSLIMHVDYSIYECIGCRAHWQFIRVDDGIVCHNHHILHLINKMHYRIFLMDAQSINALTINGPGALDCVKHS